MNEQQIKVAAKLYRVRDTARDFLKEDYHRRLKPYSDIIKNVMAGNNCDELTALLQHISSTKTYQADGMAQMMFIAATIELIKPTPEGENFDFEDDEDNFQPCDECDLPDACCDFGCAIKQGIRRVL